MSGELALVSTALSVEQVVQQRELIKSMMKSAMEEGVHYGKVPGCGDKPTLMQPGAQLLGFLFKLRPEYEIKEKDFDGDHREYQIVCRMFSQSSGAEIGQGLGICSTRESKYRYRNAAKQVTWLDDIVPPVYWTLRKRSPEDLHKWMETIFEGRDVSIIGTKKDDKGQWRFVEFHGGEGKIENENIADVINTVLKIAKKRSFVDAVITATASNDLFTQDLEDIRANLDAVQMVEAEIVVKQEIPGEGKVKVEPEKKQESKPKEKAANVKTAKTSPGEITDWKQIINHLGTPGGKVKGRPLGTMSKDTFDWVAKKAKEIANPNQQDSILIAAIAMAEAERISKPESNIGISFELLHKKCEALKIPLDVMAKVSKTLGGEATSFTQIKEEEAKHLLDNWEDTLQAVMDEQDEIPMGETEDKK